MTSQYNGHVLLIPYPSQGHINPILQFAKRLASKGVKATVATTTYTVKSIHAAAVSVEPISDGFDEGGFAQAKRADVYLRSFEANGSRTLSGVIAKYEGTAHPVNCVVYDSFFPWVLDVARRHGVHGAAFFTNSAVVCAVFAHVHGGNLAVPVVVGEEEDVVLPGIPPLKGQDLPSYLTAPESYPAYFSMLMKQFSNVATADWVFGNTFYELEGEVMACVSDVWPAKLIGPMVPSSYLDGFIEGDDGYGSSLWKPIGEEAQKWLETRPNHSVVYVSFGSMVSLSPNQMDELAWALIDSCLDFLWVVRESEQGKLPDGFSDAVTRGKGLVVSWCNQLEVLAHRAVGCFVTHCGWNSTLELLSLGVPAVAMPQFTDQFTDAKFIEDVWRVGVRPRLNEFGTVDREELGRCIKEVMEGERSEEIKRNAWRWRELAKGAISKGGSSDRVINDFVEHLKCVKGNINYE